MTEGSRSRRLSAVLMADIAGYTKLVERDTDGTVAAWKAARVRVIDPTIADYSGRIVKHTGDGFLAEFPTVREAVGCAIAMQGGLAEGPLEFRMGVNLGDVVDDGEDIHGEGVNIAARIEALAEPGGISISGGVYDQVRNQVSAIFEDLGEHEVKHVSAPVRVYRILAEAGATPTDDATQPSAGASPPVATANWQLAKVLLAPIRHLGTDAEAEALAAGLTETLAAALAHFEEFELIDPGSAEAFSERGSQDAAKQLGATYVLEGSVQLAVGKVRVGAQLIDAETGERVWSENFDRDFEDVFALQDEITAFVASTLGDAVVEEQARAMSQRPEESLDAFELTMRGLWHLHRVNADDNQVARDLFARVVDMVPDQHLPTICLCWTYALELMNGWPSSRGDALDHSSKLIRDVLRRHERSAHAHRLMGRLLLIAGNHDQGLAHADRARKLNPYHGDMLAGYGMALVWCGQTGEGIEIVERAFVINPYAPAIYKSYLSLAYFLAGRPEDGLDMVNNVQGVVGPSRVSRIANLVALDRIEDARMEARTVKEENPSFDLDRLMAGFPFKLEEVRTQLSDTLRRGGLGE